MWLRRYGSEGKKYPKRLAKGEIIGALPFLNLKLDQMLPSQRTSKRYGDYYLLNGTKNWILYQNSALFTLLSHKHTQKKKHKGINAFIVEKG